MKIHLIAVHYADIQKKNIVAFRLFDSDSGQVLDQPYNAVYTVVNNKAATIQGIKIENNTLKGSNGSFDRYPSLYQNKPLNNSLVIISSIDDVGFRVCNFEGKTTSATCKDVIKFANKVGIANGKIVTKDNKQFISAINGAYDNIPLANDKRMVELANLKKYNETAKKSFSGNFSGNIDPRRVKVITGVPNPNSRLKEIDENTGMTVEQKLAYTMLAVKQVRPFYYSIYRLLNKVEAHPKDGVSTMCVSIDTLYFNPQFVLDKSLPELLFAVLHEICHIAMRHRSRENGRDHDIWNQACDYYINKLLADEFNIPQPGVVVKAESTVMGVNSRYLISLSEKWLFSSKVNINKDTPETIYLELMEKLHEDEEDESNNQDDSGNDSQGSGNDNQESGDDESEDTNNESGNNGGDSSQSSEESEENENSQGGAGSESNEDEDSQDNESQGGSGSGQESDEEASEGNQAQGAQGKGKGGKSSSSNGAGNNAQCDDEESEGDEESDLEKLARGDDDSSSDELNPQPRKPKQPSQPNQDNSNSNNNSDDSNTSNSEEESKDKSSKGRLVGKEFRGDTIEDFESDIVDDNKSNGLSSEQVEQMQKGMLNKAVVLHKQAGIGGDTPDFIERLVQMDLAPKVDWRKALKNKLTKATQKVNTFSAPDKRFRSRNMIMPGPKKLDNDALENIKICIDTSGSISAEDIGVAFTQIKQLLSVFKAEAEVIYWDTRVRAVYPFNDIKELLKSKPAGGGGTDANCIFNYFETERDYKIGKKKPPSIIIVFTDGYIGKVNGRYSKYRDTIWVIQGNDSFKPPFGVAAPFKREQ